MRRRTLVAGVSVALLASGCSEARRPESAAPTTAVPVLDSYRGQVAYRLSDGTIELVVVPAYNGRVMWFGRCGGPNLLWELPGQEVLNDGRFNNWGGDKLFVGPHDRWAEQGMPMWPPDPSFDGPNDVTIHGPWLVLTSGELRGFGVRTRRRIALMNGAVYFESTVEKLHGPPVSVRTWQVTQTRVPDRVSFPCDQLDAMPSGIEADAMTLEQVRLDPDAAEGRIVIRPQEREATHKVGVDASPAWIVATFGPDVLEQRLIHEGSTESVADTRTATTRPTPSMPRVEYYRNGSPTAAYTEIELLSGEVRLRPGESLRSVAEWRLRKELQETPAGR